MIISVGYRVKSKQGTQFRIWATRRLKDYLVKGYAINEKRLLEKQQEVEYLKTGIRVLNRAIEGELEKNDGLIKNGRPIISNEALASLTLFIATSRADESDIVKRLIISILNRNR